ncbi:MAG TPA: zf-HC2 domain-containing protein [Pyrinomonadaceae bacterium]|nr:zf-HC2 domain-containing protein [Pyrinomonadaceae bacterium]
MHLTQKQIEDYCKHELTAAEVLSVTDHLGACEVCRTQIEAVGNGDAAFFELRSQVFEDAMENESELTSTHLTMDKAAAYVDRHLTGEELRTIDDHLAHCHDCVLAVNDLRAFRNEIAPSLDREYQPGYQPQVTTVPCTANTPRRGSLAAFTARVRASFLPAVATAALAILLLSLIAWLAWRKPQQHEPQIANTPGPASQPSASPQVTSPEPVPPAPAVVAQVNDGSRVLTLDQQGKLSGADDLPPAHQELVKKALTGGRIEKSSQLQGLSRPPSSLMGSDDRKNSFAVLEPIGNVMLTNRPTFRWTALEDATGYVVEVFDEKFNPVTASQQLTALTWMTTLPRGHVYSWQVKAMKDGQEITSPRPPAPQAKFRVLDQTKANELDNARRIHPTSHLLLGVLYADAGLLREAEQELRLMQKENPNSELARNLLRQVQSLRRQ